MQRNDLLLAQRQEALSRIDTLTKAFSLNPHIKSYFMAGEVYYSYLTAIVWGAIDTIEYDKRYVEAVRDFERDTHSLVYHAIEMADTLSLLYVSDDPANWPNERLEGNCIAAYVLNFSEPSLSEEGDIFVSGYGESGILLRIG